MALPQRWVVLSGLFLGRIVFGFGLQSMAVVAPGVAEDLSLDTAEIGTLIAALGTGIGREDFNMEKLRAAWKGMAEIH